MKKITKLSLVLVIAIVIMGSTAYAALDCNVSIKTAKSEFTKNEEFVVSVNLSDIQSEKGVIAFGATIEYDQDSLTLVKIEGKGGWSNPSYNETSGKFVTDRNGVTTSNETVIQITFKVKENSKQNPNITLKNISVSDSTKPIKKIESINKTITVKEETSTSDAASNTTNSNTNESTNSNNNTNQNTINTNESTNSGNSINKNTSNTNGSTNSSNNTNQNTNNTTGNTSSNNNTNQNTSNTTGNTSSNNNTDQNASNTNESINSNNNTIKDDDTVTTVTLPKTGNNNDIIKKILVIALIAVTYSYIKFNIKKQKQ